MDNGGIKLFVSVILGIVIALFVGVGINAFYPEPPFPEQTVTYTTEEPTEAELEESERAFDAYEQLRQQHSGVVGVISLASAVLLMGASMFLARRNMVISLACGWNAPDLLWRTSDNFFRKHHDCLYLHRSGFGCVGVLYPEEIHAIR